MTAFRHILVPTDFGAAAERALDYAIAFGKKFGSHLTLLHASWVPPASYAAFAEGVYWPTDEMNRRVQKELDDALVRAKERYADIDGVVISGEAPQVILDAAKERGCDLIVMGTHGRRGLQRVVLGSVAEKVVRFSPVPVLTVSDKPHEGRGRAEAREGAPPLAGRAETPRS